MKKGVGAVNQDEKIETIEKKVDRNAEKIDQNAEMIEANSKKIDRNADKIDENYEKLIAMIDRNAEKIDQNADQIAKLRGSDLEKSLPQRIRGHLFTKMGLRGVVIMLSALHEIDKDFMAALDKAEEDGMVTQKEWTRIVNTDLILKARARDGKEVWVAFEISGTINNDDIERVLKSADIIRRLTGKQGVAAVAGYRIPNPQAERADKMGVNVFIVN